jgi:ATP-binding cassette subfamily B protein
VLVRVRGRQGQATASAEPPSLCPELAAALEQPEESPTHALWRLSPPPAGAHALRLVLLAVLAAGGAVLEAVVLRGLLDLGRDLALGEHRWLAAICLVVFSCVLLAVELRLAAGLLRWGRGLEIRCRAALFAKLGHLHDRYLRSRPRSDMAERCHALHRLHTVPRLAGQFVQTTLTLLATAGAMIWLDPGNTVVVCVLAGGVTLLPWLLLPWLTELDLRVRTHQGALSRYYLDALQGATALRAHGAEDILQQEFDGLAVEWARASRRFLGGIVLLEGLQLAIGFGLAGWLVLRQLEHGAAGGMLLLAYWAIRLPRLAEEIGQLLRQYPTQRNIVLRLLELLGAPEENVGRVSNPSRRDEDGLETRPTDAHGVGLSFQRVSLRVGGQVILQDLNLEIEPGSHVALVGASGAGKSSLLGLLLGWYRPAEGRIPIDGRPLDAATLNELRSQTAWVDPTVQLWNQSLIANITYGCPMKPFQKGDSPPKMQGDSPLFRTGSQNAELLILDESLAALDPPLQRRVMATVAKSAPALLVIAHD